MKINGNEIKVGNVIEHQGNLWVAVKTSHVKPGKGGAFAQVELKDIINGTKLNERFRASETVERVRLDEETYQFLFAEGDILTFMHKENYEQITLPADLVGDQLPFLQDGMDVELTIYEEKPIGISLPTTVVLTVAETEAVVKGQTATSSYKPATMDNGARVMVPPFVTSGERIVVNVEASEYVERAKD